MTALEIDNTLEAPGTRAPLVLNHHDFASVTRDICAVNEAPRPPMAWYIAFIISAIWAGIFGSLILYLIGTGVGVWGNMHPVMWAFDITNFVFWVGIGHAGTLISAILFLFRQKWRTGINRSAEAMTIFAVICAGTFPGIHIGRVWLAYWLFPIPNQMEMWPQPTAVGCLRGRHVLHCVAAVLVHGHGSRSGDLARSRLDQDQGHRVWLFLARMARLESALASL